MILSAVLLITVTVLILILLKQFKPEPPVDIIPNCKFKITTPKFEIDGNKKFVRYSVIVDNIDKWFLDFPVMFKFYSDYKFKTKIRITYEARSEDSQREIIYDKLLLFEEETKEHVYYITDVILGRIDFEIELEVDYGQPIISFEILENSMCTLTEEYYIEIKFPIGI